MVPERSICGDSLLECFGFCFFFRCLFLCFILCSRREYRAPNGNTACLPSTFVLEGFLTSQPKNTQTLLLPWGKIRTGNSLIERKPAWTPYTWAHCGMFDHSKKEKKEVWESKTPSFSGFLFLHSSIMKCRKVEDMSKRDSKLRTVVKICPS